VFFTHSAHATLANDIAMPTEQIVNPVHIRSATINTVDPLTERRPIFIHTFIHDEILDQESEIFSKHFLPMVKELKALTGRRVTVLFIRNQPPYTNFSYKSEDEQAIALNWRKLAIQYRNDKNLPSTGTTKFLIITKDLINSRTAGLAGLGDQVAIAALNTGLTVGHEIGHTLNATHENSKVFLTPWPCDSYMIPNPTFGYSNCDRYSDENRKRINAFLSKLP
jgi:hypothetical protein